MRNSSFTLREFKSTSLTLPAACSFPAMPGYSSVIRENHNEVKYSLGQTAALGTGSLLQMKITAMNYPSLGKYDVDLKIFGRKLIWAKLSHLQCHRITDLLRLEKNSETESNHY